MDLAPGRHHAGYVLPLRWPAGHDPQQTAELGRYLERLAALVDDVVVVDGSEPAVRAQHERAWSGSCRVVPPQPWPGRNGKVAGVVTGIRLTPHERVVVADDDVRYADASLSEVLDALEGADLVRPQNVFDPAPWHARWDTGRALLNRALGHDHPGTCGVRRSTFLRMGGYDGDVLFENLELARTVTAAGGRVVDLPGTFVRRIPPTPAHFRAQRVRQAYDDLAQPLRLAAELAVLPAAVGLLRARWPGLLVAAAAGAVLLAERGRRRAGGAAAYPSTAALWAPLWLGERAVCIWLAVVERSLGGARYGGQRLPRAASSRRRLAAQVPSRAPLGELPADLTGPAGRR